MDAITKKDIVREVRQFTEEVTATSPDEERVLKEMSEAADALKMYAGSGGDRYEKKFLQTGMEMLHGEKFSVSIRHAAINQIASLDTPLAVQVLIAMIRSGNEQQIDWAINALKQGKAVVQKKNATLDKLAEVIRIAADGVNTRVLVKLFDLCLAWGSQSTPEIYAGFELTGDQINDDRKLGNYCIQHKITNNDAARLLLLGLNFFKSPVFPLLCELYDSCADDILKGKLKEAFFYYLPSERSSPLYKQRLAEVKAWFADNRNNLASDSLWQVWTILIHEAVMSKKELERIFVYQRHLAGREEIVAKIKQALDELQGESVDLIKPDSVRADVLKSQQADDQINYAEDFAEAVLPGYKGKKKATFVGALFSASMVIGGGALLGIGLTGRARANAAGNRAYNEQNTKAQQEALYYWQRSGRTSVAGGALAGSGVLGLGVSLNLSGVFRRQEKG